MLPSETLAHVGAGSLMSVYVGDAVGNPVVDLGDGFDVGRAEVGTKVGAVVGAVM